MDVDPDRRLGPLATDELQDVLDASVRALAVSSGDMRERVASAALALARASRHDFRHRGDRELIDRVRLALMRLDLAEHDAGDLAEARPGASEEMLEAIAEDIVRLRDEAMARAIRDVEGAG